MPTYNRSSFLEASIGSILNQTFQEWELIIIDDGSTDDTKLVAKKFNDCRIKYYYQENAGRSNARNNGIKISLGQFLFFLDSDDHYYPNHLEVHKKAIEQSKNSFFLFHTWYNLNRNGERESIPFKNFDSQEPLKLNRMEGPMLPCISFPRSIFKSELFNEELSICEDIEMILRVLSYCPIKTSGIITFQYNLHGGNSIMEYSIDYLENLALSWSIISVQHSKYYDKVFLKKRLFNIYSGLADKYSRCGRKLDAIKSLIQSIQIKPTFLFSRYLGGIIRNIIQ